MTIPATGLVATYDAPNAPFQVQPYPLREPQAGEVLVRVSMSTICRSDIHSYQGHRPNPCPGVLGLVREDPGSPHIDSCQSS